MSNAIRSKILAIAALKSGKVIDEIISLYGKYSYYIGSDTLARNVFTSLKNEGLIDSKVVGRSGDGSPSRIVWTLKAAAPTPVVKPAQATFTHDKASILEMMNGEALSAHETWERASKISEAALEAASKFTSTTASQEAIDADLLARATAARTEVARRHAFELASLYKSTKELFEI